MIQNLTVYKQIKCNSFLGRLFQNISDASKMHAADVFPNNVLLQLIM